MLDGLFSLINKKILIYDAYNVLHVNKFKVDIHLFYFNKNLFYFNKNLFFTFVYFLSV